MKKENKIKFENARKIYNEDTTNGFEYLYFIPQRKKHDSGYNYIKVYGEKNNEIYLLSEYSDVLDFNKIVSDYEWFGSIDIPDYNIIRLFARNNRKIYCEYFHCSSFSIKIK